jgi:hypothetical protein
VAQININYNGNACIDGKPLVYGEFILVTWPDGHCQMFQVNYTNSAWVQLFYHGYQIDFNLAGRGLEVERL